MKVKRFFQQLYATFFFIGYIPLAPGTWASLAAIGVWLLIAFSSFWSYLILIIVCFFAGIFASEAIENRIGEIDPGYIVIDEVVGMWLTLLFIHPVKFPADLGKILFAFLLFRAFDIFKLKPIKKLELIGGGFGIMIDDVIAACLAGAIFRIILLIL